MDPGSVGRKVQPKLRVVTMTEMVWFVVRSVMGITVPRIIIMVSVNLMAPVIIFVMVPVTRPNVAITCLRWRRPSDQKHCLKSGYYNFTDVFHFYSPFIRISRRGDEKGCGFIKEYPQGRRHGWV